MNLPTTTYRFIFHFVRQQKWKFFLLALSSVVWASNDVFFPYFIKRLVDSISKYQGNPENIYSAVKGTLILLVLFWVVTEFFQRGQGFLQVFTFPQFRAKIRSSVFKYVQSHSHDYFTSHFAGSIAKKLADLPTSCQSILEIMCFQIITVFTGAFIVLVMMWLTHPIFAVIVFFWLCFHVLLTVLFIQFGNPLWEAHSKAETTLSGKIIDALSNMLNVRLFARAKYELHYLAKYQHDEIAKAKKATGMMELTRIGLGLNGLFLIFSMIFMLLHGWVQHWVSLGDFTQVGMQAFWLLGFMWFLSYQMTIYTREMGVIGNALSLVRKSHGLVDIKDAKPITITRGEIQFHNVTFAYQKNRDIFKNLNLKIRAGEKVGLVGFSGSGKTTFVNLMLRFYDVQSGEILIDGQDISKITQDSLRSQIAMIPQDPALFHRSLMDNIRYGSLNATDDEVIEASKLAHCHEFISKLDGTYDALVGERGVKLSGGQRQRIAIARAILKNSPILILDEATSALDSVTEKLIQDSLHHLMQNRTTIVVAHRLSTLNTMNRIIVFHHGRIIEEGTQDELLKAKGHFAMLWAMQTDGFLPES